MRATMRSGRTACVARAAAAAPRAPLMPSRRVQHALAGGLTLLLAPAAHAADTLQLTDVDFSQVGELAMQNPAVAAGAAVSIMVAAIAASLSSGGDAKPKAVGTSAEQAIEALSSDVRTVLLDVRSKADVKADGAPDIRATGRKLLSLPFLVVGGQSRVEPVHGVCCCQHASCRPSHLLQATGCSPAGASRRPARRLVAITASGAAPSGASASRHRPPPLAGRSAARRWRLMRSLPPSSPSCRAWTRTPS
jgi:hypothetical protein